MPLIFIIHISCRRFSPTQRYSLILCTEKGQSHDEYWTRITQSRICQNSKLLNNSGDHSQQISIYPKVTTITQLSSHYRSLEMFNTDNRKIFPQYSRFIDKYFINEGKVAKLAKTFSWQKCGHSNYYYNNVPVHQSSQCVWAALLSLRLWTIPPPLSRWGQRSPRPAVPLHLHSFL